MRDVLLHVARDGENLGSWPLDIVSALRRSGILKVDDIYTLNGFEDWKPIGELLPDQQLDLPTAIITAADEVDVRWGYYCRDGHVVEGPRRMDEINALCEAEYLTDEHKLFVVGEGRWCTIREKNMELAAFSSLAKHPANALSMAHPGFGWALNFGARLVDGFLAGDKPSHIETNPFTVAFRKTTSPPPSLVQATSTVSTQLNQGRKSTVFFGDFPEDVKAALAEAATEAGYLGVDSLDKEPTIYCCNGRPNDGLMRSLRSLGIEVMSEYAFRQRMTTAGRSIGGRAEAQENRQI